MDAFRGIARTWLTAVSERQLDLKLQVIQSDSGDLLAQQINDMARRRSLKSFCFEYRQNQIADPLELLRQLLSWLGEIHGRDQVEKKIGELSYPLQRESLLNWFNRSYYYRDQPLLIEEVEYERLELYISIQRLLAYFSKLQPFVILIKNIHLASDQIHNAVNLISQFRQKRGGWGILGFIPASSQMRVKTTSDAWQDCLQSLERSNSILVVTDVGEVRKRAVKWRQAADLTGRDQIYSMLLSALDLFAFQDAIKMVQILKTDLDGVYRGKLFFIRAYSELMDGDLDNSIRDFAIAQDCLQSTDDNGLLTACYYWQSVCYSLKSQIRYARAAQEQCEKLALSYANSRWYALSQFAAFYINLQLEPENVNQVALESLRFLLSELKYTNMLVLVQTQVYSNNPNFSGVGPKKYLMNCVSALRMARELRNQLGISSALYSMGQVNFLLGNIKQTRRLFEISLRLREKYQHDTELVPLLNGLGYFYLGQEDWHQAWALFSRSLDLLLSYSSVNDAGDTLYNFLWLYVLSDHTDRAQEIMTDLLELLRIRGSTTLPYRNLKDLYILKGWLHCIEDQPIQARYCLLRIESLADLSESAFSRILLKIVEARIALTENSIEAASDSISSAHRLLNKQHNMDANLHHKLMLETAHLYEVIQRPDAANSIFKVLQDIAASQSGSVLAKRLQQAIKREAPSPDQSVPPLNQPYRVLLGLALKETQIAKVQHELSGLHQANLLLHMSSEEPDVQTFLSQMIEILNKRVPADSFAVFVSNSSAEGPASDKIASSGVDDMQLVRWRKKLFTSPPHWVNFIDNKVRVSAWPLMMETSEQSWLLVAGDEQQNAVWNTDFLELVAQQLGLVLDRRQREAFLEHRNKTDILTGALNRSGLNERLKKQFSQMTRCPEQSFALCYFDLDHFKYFNDRFGHDLGDKVLKNLVECVEAELRGSDELGRLGGDEFIILLKDTGKEEVAALMERLRKRIATPDWWLPLLIDIADQQQQNPVPESEWISASFGVVVMSGWPKEGIDRIDLIAQGDAAMYRAKNRGKNCIVIDDYRPLSKKNSLGPVNRF